MTRHKSRRPYDETRSRFPFAVFIIGGILIVLAIIMIVCSTPAHAQPTTITVTGTFILPTGALCDGTACDEDECCTVVISYVASHISGVYVVTGDPTYARTNASGVWSATLLPSKNYKFCFMGANGHPAFPNCEIRTTHASGSADYTTLTIVEEGGGAFTPNHIPATTIDGVQNPGGDIDFVAGSGITITADDAANTITYTATTGASKWDETATAVTTNTSNLDIVSNFGTGEIGTSADKWDNAFFELLTVATTFNVGGSGTTITGAELETLSDLSNADLLHVHGVAGIPHTITDHSDVVDATGTQLEELTGGAVTALHDHAAGSLVHTLDDAYDDDAGGERSIIMDAGSISFEQADAANDYLFTIDNTTAGDMLKAFEIFTSAGGTIQTAITASDADIVTAIDIGANQIKTAASTLSSTEIDILDNGITHSEITSVTSDQHHGQVHALSGSDHSGDLPADRVLKPTLFDNSKTYTLGKTTPSSVELRVGHDGANALVNTFFIHDHAHSGTAGSGAGIPHSGTTGQTSGDHHTKTIDASELTTGTLPDARLSSEVMLLGTVQTVTAQKTWGTSNKVSFGSAAGATLDFYAKDATDDMRIETNSSSDELVFFENIGAGNLDVKVSGDVTAVGDVTGVNVNATTQLQVGGAQVDYDDLAGLAGTVPDARLSSNVDLLDTAQTFSADKTWGSSNKVILAPAVGTIWSLYTENTGDDLQVEANTPATEVIDFNNIGSGVVHLNLVDGVYQQAGVALNYSHITANDSGTDITAGNFETLSDGSNADALHIHGAGGLTQSLDDAYNDDTGERTITVDAGDISLDLNDSVNDYKFVIDNTTTGTIAAAFIVTTTGAGSSFTTGADLSDAGLVNAIDIGNNDFISNGVTLTPTELNILDDGVTHTEVTGVTAGQHHTKTTDASELTAGTLPDARLSSNVMILDTAQTVTSNKTWASSKKVILAPATGPAWDLYVEDTGDDMQIEVDSASTETLDIVNVGAGVIDVTIEGDLTITGDDLKMTTNTSGAVLVADGTNFNPVTMSGDATINTAGVIEVTQADSLETNAANCAAGESAGGVSASGAAEDCLNPITETEMDTEAELEAQLTDVSDVFTNNDVIGDANINDNITAVNYCKLSGGVDCTMTGQLITDNLGTEYTESDVNPTCAAGNYTIYADLSETKLKKCQDGVLSDFGNNMTFKEGGATIGTRPIGNWDGGDFDLADDAGNDEVDIALADVVARTDEVKTITALWTFGGAKIQVAANEWADADVQDGITVVNYCKLSGGVDCTMTGALVIDDTSIQIQEGVDTMTITVPALTAARAVTIPDIGGEVMMADAAQTLTGQKTIADNNVTTYNTPGDSFELDTYLSGASNVMRLKSNDTDLGFFVFQNISAVYLLSEMVDNRMLTIGNAFAIKNKIINTIAGGNTINQYRTIQLHADAARIETGAPDFQTNDGTNFTWPRWNFDKDVDECITWAGFALPGHGFDTTGTIRCQLMWNSVGTTLENRWCISVTAGQGEGEDIDQAFGTETCVDDTVQGTTLKIGRTVNMIPADDWLTRDYIAVKLCRKGAHVDDDLDSDSWFLGGYCEVPFTT